MTNLNSNQLQTGLKLNLTLVLFTLSAMEDKSILSIKIVSVDHYNCYPINNLDTTHSDFRKSAVKQVPVIRIFGITQNKKKICANVHGVFPYFYIPCAETDHEMIAQLMSELADTLDKSINISFGQSSSNAQHVFRISLVKGIPFYGYHEKEHQFFRVQLYNPNLARRVSNLLQSGSILGKQFQPHESHIPYILKFFIDYNLFGMSYIHVPLQCVHTRYSDDKSKFRKRSVSQIEVDFKAIYILNRLAAEEEDANKAANPGIESIWEDERQRRSAMDSESVPPLASILSQSNECRATDSDIFFKTILRDKLAEWSNQSNQSLSMLEEEVPLESGLPKKKFDLKNFLDTSVYAAEYSQSSFSNTTSQSSNVKSTVASVVSETIEDLEDKFLNLSQNKSSQESSLKSSMTSLNESVVSQSIDDLENDFLNFSQYTDNEDLQRLKEQCQSNDFENDSLLAPLTQAPASSKYDLNQSIKNNNVADEKCEDPFFDSGDDDDDMFNNLNETVANMEIFSQYVHDEEDETFPQLDGVDDELEIQSSSEKKVPKTNELKFHPQPGPSHINMSPARFPVKIEAPSPGSSILNSSFIQNNLKQLAVNFDDTSEKYEAKSAPQSDEEMFDEDDDLITSFYNRTMMIDDFVSSNEENSDEETAVKIESFKPCIITPVLEPPTLSEAIQFLKEAGIPKVINPIPIYSVSKDVTGKKEVGHNILEIPGNRLGDLEDFQSNLFKTNQMKQQKQNMQRYETVNIDDVFAMHPCNEPPSYQDAVDWLTSNAKEDTQQPLEESPVKDIRNKTLMVLELEDDNVNDSNATLTPGTPFNSERNDSPDMIPSSVEKDTPTLSEYVEDGLCMTFKSRMKRKKLKTSFSKRFQEIMKAKVATSLDSESTSLSPLTVEIEKNSQEVSQSTESSSKFSDQNSSVIVRNANVQEDLSFNNSCDLTGPSLNNTYGFKMKLESLQSNDEHTDLTTLSMELHVQTRKDLKPNPEFDAISAIFYSLDGFYSGNEVKAQNGIIACVNDSSFKYVRQGVDVITVKSEADIFEVFFHKIREFDPDIFAGYEIETASWGYLVQRGYVLNMNLNNALSRMPSDKAEREKAPAVVDDEDQRDMGDYYSEQKIPGRILLDVWRLMKHEIALTSYSFENICYHVLHRRYPKHSFSFLTSQWDQPMRMWIVFEYYHERSRTLIEILKQLDLIGRTCELAKLFGIQFYEVLSRGSQFRVESMMIRIAKRRNYVPVSPSVQQRVNMRAPEYIPLILEPESRFYSDPVIVLDFQSLYPSIIIAYNYCFSTCLGRVEFLSKPSSQPFEFGAYQLRVSPSRLQYLIENDLITVSPCGVAYVTASVREGVLPRMLREILDTRLMVKQSMKIHKTNSALQRVLHSRQMGLKLIANVTYGYTAANFSGRMPAIEVGDSVVSKGRETLERAIKLVESNKEWNCRVCYGDTDSMFVLVPGRSKEEAFEIGAKIAEAVTNDNPNPIKLKLEKVYQPCILQTKKRYVGSMYESPDQKDPIYEAKGIETVRRDGCPAASKILEKTLKILFETCDVSKVKEYVCRQFTKILAGRCSIQDLLFAKEFRGINGYKEKACVPSLVLTRKWKLSDPRNEPRRGERVPFLIVNGAPGLTLIKLVRSPLEVLQDENYKINSIYYITKAIIPPLNRCLLLIGANAFDWFTELPRRQQFIPLISNSSLISNRKGTISQFFSTSACATCDNQCNKNICLDCRRDSQKTVLALTQKVYALENKALAMRKICESCCRRSFDVDCISLDCPVLYASTKAKRDMKQIKFYQDLLDEF